MHIHHAQPPISLIITPFVQQVLVPCKPEQEVQSLGWRRTYAFVDCRPNGGDAWQHQPVGVPIMWCGSHDDACITKEAEEQEGYTLYQV